MVAWQTDQGSFWLSNTLIQSLSDREMIEIAQGMTEPRRPSRADARPAPQPPRLRSYPA